MCVLLLTGISQSLQLSPLLAALAFGAVARERRIMLSTRKATSMCWAMHCWNYMVLAVDGLADLHFSAAIDAHQAKPRSGSGLRGVKR